MIGLLLELDVAKIEQGSYAVENLSHFLVGELDGAHALEHNFKVRFVLWQYTHLGLIRVKVVFGFFQAVVLYQRVLSIRKNLIKNMEVAFNP